MDTPYERKNTKHLLTIFPLTPKLKVPDFQIGSCEGGGEAPEGVVGAAMLPALYKCYKHSSQLEPSPMTILDAANSNDNHYDKLN